MTQKFELKLEATGEARDADGNLVEQIPVQTTVEVTEEQARAILEQQAQAQRAGGQS